MMHLLLITAITLQLALVQTCSRQKQLEIKASGGKQLAQTMQTPASEAENNPQEVATRALSTLQKLTTTQTYQALGFESVEDASRVTLGEPLRVFYVRLDRLREFQNEVDVRQMLSDADKYIYPVLVDGNPRSAMVVEQKAGIWKAVRFGRTMVIEEYLKLRDLKAANGRRDFIAIQIPAMKLNFLGHNSEGAGAGGGELALTPLPSNSDADRNTRLFNNDRDIVGFRSSRASANNNKGMSTRYNTSSSDKRASAIFSKLVPKAREINSDVPR